MPKLVTFVLLLAFTAAVPAGAQSPAKHEPLLVGVIMYADWCNSCKVLEPNIDQVKREFKDSGVLFLRFDMTDEFTTAQSEQLASLLDLHELFLANRGKTGFMMLFDRRDGTASARLTRNDDAEAIRNAIRAAL